MKKARAHGIGVHSQEEISELGKSDLLADKPFIFRNASTLLDVVAFANLAQLHSAEAQHPLRDAMAESFPNLAGLVTRVQKRAFPDWQEVVAREEPAPPKQIKDKENKELKDKDDKEKEKTASDEPDKEKRKGDEKEKEPDEKESEKEK